MTKNNYNGYTNYETWATALHIDNDEYTQDYFKDAVMTALSDNEGDREESICCIVNTIEYWLEESKPEVEGIYTDLLNAAIAEVDKYDIAKIMIDENLVKWQKENSEKLKRLSIFHTPNRKEHTTQPISKKGSVNV